MQYIVVFSGLVTIIVGLIATYQFIKGIQHPIARRPGAILGVITVILIVFTVVLSNSPSSRGGDVLNPTPSTDQLSVTHTATQQVPSPTPTTVSTQPTSPTPTMEPTPTPTPGIKSGDVLYTADFSNKASDWSFDDNWFISNGKLIGKSADSQALLNVPIPTTDYTVKASIIITQVGTFGVVARYQSPTQGDVVALAWVTNTYIALSTCPSDDCAGPTSDRIPFLQTNRVYNLSITCKGVHITVTGEGHIISADDTSNAPAAGNVALFNSGMGVEVLSLQIIAA